MNTESIIYCRQCGQKNAENNHKCTSCDALLHASPAPKVVVADDGTLGGLVPYKNSSALWAYYLGIFSILPIIGIPLGVAALISGIRGLKFARSHPEAKGKVHAWIGIIVGGFFAALYLSFVLYAINN